MDSTCACKPTTAAEADGAGDPEAVERIFAAAGTGVAAALTGRFAFTAEEGAEAAADPGAGRVSLRVLLAGDEVAEEFADECGLGTAETTTLPLTLPPPLLRARECEGGGTDTNGRVGVAAAVVGACDEGEATADSGIGESSTTGVAAAAVAAGAGVRGAAAGAAVAAGVAGATTTAAVALVGVAGTDGAASEAAALLGVEGTDAATGAAAA